ncbi:Sec-independent protein translocase subunit TatA [Streptomyces sp. NPDC097610]|uniref:Sec-independent protein translocase subunit TatA n=1 Tax=Streptomyces sp. NPDC097610 TaxID=3157227 RepID=UPI00332A6A14
MLRNGLEPWHLLIVAIVLIVLFGSKKLPDTARALGKSMRILKSETKAMKDEDPASAATAEQRTAPVTPTAVIKNSAEQAAPRATAEAPSAAH